MKIKELKNKCKESAVLIRQDKARYKDCQRGKTTWQSYYDWRKENSIGMWTDLSYDARHMHIAYCLLRGRKYEEIENKVKPGNEPAWSRIENIMREYREVEQISDGDMVV